MSETYTAEAIRQQAERELAAVRQQIADVNKSKKTLNDRLDKLRSERRRLERICREPPSGRRRNSADPLGVSTVELAPYIKHWIEQNNENGSGGLKTLSIRSGLSTRYIRRLLNSESRFTTLSVAEDLIVAMGLQNALIDGRIRVVSNPYFYKNENLDCGT